MFGQFYLLGWILKDDPLFSDFGFEVGRRWCLWFAFLWFLQELCLLNFHFRVLWFVAVDSAGFRFDAVHPQ